MLPLLISLFNCPYLLFLLAGKAFIVFIILGLLLHGIVIGLGLFPTGVTFGTLDGF